MCAQGQRSENESILRAIMESVHKKRQGGWNNIRRNSRNEMQERNFVICHAPTSVLDLFLFEQVSMGRCSNTNGNNGMVALVLTSRAETWNILIYCLGDLY